MSTALFDPRYQAVDANGQPYSGAKLYFYASGTTTPITVYQDGGATTPHANPVVADASGTFAEIFITTDPFKVVLTTSGGTVLDTIDAIPLNAAATDADLTAIAALSGTGFPARTTTNTWVLRTLTSGTGVAITNPAGVAGDPTIAVDKATAANIRAGTADKVLTADGLYAAAAEVTLTDAATVTVDGNAFLNAVLTLGGNRTLGTWANPKPGQTGRIRVVQDATGSRTLSYHADYEFPGAVAIVLSTAAASQDLLYYDVLASGRVALYANKAMG